jgi:hypothetical protein
LRAAGERHARTRARAPASLGGFPRFVEKAGDGVGAVADAELRRGPRASYMGFYSLQHGRYQNPSGFPNSHAEDCVMDGPTLAFFVVGLAIVAIFLILMIQGD